MTPQELKNSILQLAIQGKLVEQRAEEGTAEELYKQIQAEKQKLIEEGKIKKEKPLPEITEDEKPFDIPEGWMWVRFGLVSQLLDGTKCQGTKYPYLEAKYLRGRSEATIFDNGKFISAGTRTILVDGENSGEVFLVSEDGYIGSTFKVLYFSDELNASYVLFYLQLHKSDYRNNKKGSAIPHLNKDLFFNMPFPIPPLAEQRRIVAKIEELLPYIERYEKAWSRLEELNRRFPEDMQKSILQLAIQGKLVEQRAEEGTAEELYKQIQAEKQRLIKEGKIKKEKPLPEITEDEKPFDIPEGWKWVRFGSIIDMLSGFAFKSEEFTKNGKYRLLRGINLGVGNVRWDDTEYIDNLTEQKNNFRINNGDVLLGLDRPLISDGIRVAIFNEEHDAFLVQRVLRIRNTLAITKEYIVMMLRSELFKNAVESQTTGISVPHISPSQVASLAIPLPPLAEQCRIVARLEQILPLCERLKSDGKSAKTISKADKTEDINIQELNPKKIYEVKQAARSFGEGSDDDMQELLKEYARIHKDE